jgi:hypothetical protein
MQSTKDLYLEKIDELLGDADVEAILRDLNKVTLNGKLLLATCPGSRSKLLADLSSGELFIEVRPKTLAGSE